MSAPDQYPETTSETSELLIGLVLLAVAGFFAYHSLELPRPDGWGTAPGLLPLIFSMVLLVVAAGICIASVRRGAFRQIGRGGDMTDPSRPRFFARCGREPVTLIVIALFYFGFLAVLPFEISAALFFICMTTLYWKQASWLRRAIVSVCLPFVVTIIFQAGFGVPLPGEGNLVEVIMNELQQP